MTALMECVEHVNEGPGFSLEFSFAQTELQHVRQWVVAQWSDHLREIAPEHCQTFLSAGIEQYHDHAYLLNHSMAWPKQNRILPQSAVDYIRSTSLFQNLEAVFGKFSIADEENVGREEIYWRLVRPDQSSDVGPLHADNWFWSLGHGVTPPNTERVKVWVAIFCEPGLNGLRVVPHSQKKDWKYHGEYRDGFSKPQIDVDEAELSPQLVHTKPGNAIVFHDKLLHGGAVNQGDKTRVSIEFTMFVKQ